MIPFASAGKFGLGLLALLTHEDSIRRSIIRIHRVGVVVLPILVFVFLLYLLHYGDRNCRQRARRVVNDDAFAEDSRAIQALRSRTTRASCIFPVRRRRSRIGPPCRKLKTASNRLRARRRSSRDECCRTNTMARCDRSEPIAARPPDTNRDRTASRDTAKTRCGTTDPRWGNRRRFQPARQANSARTACCAGPADSAAFHYRSVRIVVEPNGVSHTTTCDASGAVSEPDCVSVTSPVTSSGRGRGVLTAALLRPAASEPLEVFALPEATQLPAAIARTAPAITQKRIREFIRGWVHKLKKKSHCQSKLIRRIRRPVDVKSPQPPILDREKHIRPRLENIVGKQHLISRGHREQKRIALPRAAKIAGVPPARPNRDVEFVARIRRDT